jgi:hypothetical protein
MQSLNLPAYTFDLRRDRGKEAIFDPVRKKWVRLTPEEWVRQHFVQYLIWERAVPAGLVAIEMGFTYQRMKRRADIVVYDRQGKPALMVECKAPVVEVRQAAFDQVARYNTVVKARYLVVTNGLMHYCCAIDRAAHSYRFIETLPPYDAW